MIDWNKPLRTKEGHKEVLRVEDNKSNLEKPKYILKDGKLQRENQNIGEQISDEMMRSYIISIFDDLIVEDFNQFSSARLALHLKNKYKDDRITKELIESTLKMNKYALNKDNFIEITDEASIIDFGSLYPKEIVMNFNGVALDEFDDLHRNNKLFNQMIGRINRNEVITMELKDVKKINLKEAKKQFDEERSNAEIEYAKRELRKAVDAINQLDSQIKILEESKKAFQEIVDKFK